MLSHSRFESVSDRLRNTFVHSHYEGRATVELPLSLFVEGYAWYDEVDYLLPFLTERGVPQPRVDHYWTWGGSLLRQFGDRVRLGVTVGLTQRTSSFQSLAFERVVYGVQGQMVP